MSSLMIVAELSANHCGDYAKAEQLVRHAAAAGADAIKLQTFMSCEMAPRSVHIKSGPWAGRTYRALYEECRTRLVWHGPLFSLAKSLGMVAFSAPFSVESVNFLEELNCPIYKIASPEIIHYPLIKAVAATGKPLIISTGMAARWEIQEAVEVACQAGAKLSDITLLHCISAYPARTCDFNLETLDFLKTFGCQVGLSDHSRGNVAAVAAVAKGASVIEKHFCLSRSIQSPDVAFSADPSEFRLLVQQCGQIYETLGEVQYGCREAESDSYQYRRSLWVVKAIKAGEAFTEDNVAVLRPNYGMHPKFFDKLMGLTASVDISPNTPLRMKMVRE